MSAASYHCKNCRLSVEGEIKDTIPGDEEGTVVDRYVCPVCKATVGSLIRAGEVRPAQITTQGNIKGLTQF